MRYTARALTHACRPVVLTIGRPDGSRLRRWWVRRFRTFTARPVSALQMLALQSAGTDAVAMLVETARLLRAVLPRRWWYRFTGDPVGLLLTLPNDLRQQVLAALLAMPTEAQAALSDMDEVRRNQRAAVYGARQAGGPRPTLAVASLACRVAFGDRWWYAPDRWPTADGYVPFSAVWIEFVGLQSLEARERLVVADGTALATSKDANRVRRQLLAMAYPEEGE